MSSDSECVFTYTLTVRSNKRITPHITGARLEKLLDRHFKDGECTLELTHYEGKKVSTESEGK